MRCGDRKLKKLLPRKDYVVCMPAAAETLDFDIALVTRLNALAEFGFDTTIAWCKALLMQMPTSSRAPRFLDARGRRTCSVRAGVSAQAPKTRLNTDLHAVFGSLVSTVLLSRAVLTLIMSRQ
jgi:hypothetical protein